MKHFRKTKIIATFGPALKNEKVFAKAMKSGVNLIRFNFSHLTLDSARKQLSWVKKQLKSIKHDVGFLADLKGPEIRTDMETYTLQTGEEIYFCHNSEKMTIVKREALKENPFKVIGIDHIGLHKLVKKDQKILADDGYFEFKVLEVDGKAIRLRVTQGGILKTKKSVIVPGVDIQLPILNQQDKKNLKFIVKENFAWIAASFVSSAQDVEEIRNFVHKCRGYIPIISKIENHKGVSNIDDILNDSNGVMIARGDLGLEYPFEEVPILQENIINKAKVKGVVTVIATQMLNSMIENPRPSRPEVSDISYAIRSRVDAVMLSGETASGKYPDKAVVAMNQIINSSESFYQDNSLSNYNKEYRLAPFCEMAIKLAFAVGARCLIAVSAKGKSARYLSAFRSNLINIVATQNRSLYYRSFLYYSVHPLMIESFSHEEKSFIDIIKKCKTKGYFKRGDKFIHIFTYRSPHVSKKFELPTNSIREGIVE